MTQPTEQSSTPFHSPFSPSQVPVCLAAIRKHAPLETEAVTFPLGTIWDEVVHRIIEEMMALPNAKDDTDLHIGIREDMIFELARLQLWLGERVVEKRLDGRQLCTISPDEEREACLGPKGADIISGTARLAYDHIWKRKMDERWKPKSAMAFKRAEQPRKTKLAVKPVAKNHFIPRWFLKDNWSTDNKLLRWKRTDGGWSAAPRTFGQWGYRHALYSDWLEAYFALIEGDAKRPIEMLLNTQPLNGPQRDALVGFLIIQMLRNPYFIEALQKGIAPIIAEVGHADDPTMASRAYEAMFRNSKLYDRFAHPIMWSRWAIVKSDRPVFVLPDRFGVQADLGNGLRMIAPLTPKACFITLPDLEDAKRVVPYFLEADDVLARGISATLIGASETEFVSHPEFTFDQTPAPAFSKLLNEIGEAIAMRETDQGQPRP